MDISHGHDNLADADCIILDVEVVDALWTIINDVTDEGLNQTLSMQRFPAPSSRLCHNWLRH